MAPRGGERMERKAATTLRAIASGALGCLAVGLLASGTCVVHARHCTDADGDGRCDHEHPPRETSTAPGAEPWLDVASAAAELFRIERFTLVVGSGEAGETRRVEDIRGVSLDRIVPRSGDRAHDARSIRVFGDRVLDVNQGLLGLDGRRELEGLTTDATGSRLDYAVGPGARVRLFLDPIGNLIAVVSRTDASRAATDRTVGAGAHRAGPPGAARIPGSRPPGDVEQD